MPGLIGCARDEPVEVYAEFGGVWCRGVSSGRCWPTAARRNGELGRAAVASRVRWFKVVGNIRQDASKGCGLLGGMLVDCGCCWVADGVLPAMGSPWTVRAR